MPIAHFRMPIEAMLRESAIGNRKAAMLSSSLNAIHHLCRQRRQVHRLLWIALPQISDDVEHRNRSNQLAILYQPNAAKASFIHQTPWFATGWILSRPVLF